MAEKGLKRKKGTALAKTAKVPKVADASEEQECVDEPEETVREDYFASHFSVDLEETEARHLLDTDVVNTAAFQLPSMGSAVRLTRSSRLAQLNPSTDWTSLQALGVRKNLRDNMGEQFSADQNDFYQLLARYTDVLKPTGGGADELRLVYCVHALNHALRTRRLVLLHNARLRELKESGQLDDAAMDKFRDQGLARPKVLIVCPFRKTAMHVVDTITRLLFGTGSKKFVTNRKRFVKEFGGSGNDISHRKDVDDDYKVS